MQILRQINDTIDNIGDIENKLNYTGVLVGNLLDDYDGIDLEEMRKKISWELPRVQAFLNIIFDYCHAAKEKSNETLVELDKLADEIKKRNALTNDQLSLKSK